MSKLNNALLEIGLEEVPARFMPELLADLKKKAEEKLNEARLTFHSVKTLGTPRRLTLFIEELSAKQPDIDTESQGPPAEIAYKDNKPNEAAIGFAKKSGVNVSDLIIRTHNGRNYVFAKIRKKGQPAEKVLSELFPDIIKNLHMPIAMRWSDIDFEFIRPIHWLLSLYGSKVVKFTLAGVRSGNMTSGHRFVTKVKVKIQKAKLDEYKSKLKTAQVIVDQDERKTMIQKQIKKLAPKAQVDMQLLSEVTYLCENPIAMLGKFDPAFLAIPKEVLITSMKKNQKYFPVLDANQKMTASFVFIANGCKNKLIADGNRKVLSARLSDAKFFFEEDRKVPLRVRINDLKKVGFFEKLGNMHEKTERLVKLSENIAQHLKIDGNKLPKIKKIAELCKADLTTQMVFEFPELQGVMGREYASLEGEEAVVAEGIFEHYLPRFAEDRLPRTMEGTVVSLADKIDTLVGCFAVGAVPTGSVDPYGLRRAAYGIVKIIIDKELDISLEEMVNQALKLYRFDNVTADKVYRPLMDFVGGRLRVLLLEEKIPYDIVDAVLSNLIDINEAVKFSKVLAQHKQEAWFLGIHATANRLSRITRNVKRENVVEADLVEEEEKKIHELYLKINWDVTEKINQGQYEGALRELARLTEPVESFFKNILVMHEDERIKTNRLALLRSIEKTFLLVADFTKIVL